MASESSGSDVSLTYSRPTEPVLLAAGSTGTPTARLRRRRLSTALDAEKAKRDLSSAGVAATIWDQSRARNARRSDHPVSASTITGTGKHGFTDCQHALFMLRWSDVDAVAVGVSENEAPQSVIGVTHPFDYTDTVGGEVVVENGRVGDQQVCDVATAGSVILCHRRMQLSRVAFQDDEPDWVAVFKGHPHPEQPSVEGERSIEVADGDRARNPAEDHSGFRLRFTHQAPQRSKCPAETVLPGGGARWPDSQILTNGRSFRGPAGVP